LARAGELAGAGVARDAVLAEQVRHAVGVLLHHRAPPLLHGAQVEADVVRDDAVRAQLGPGLLVEEARLQQRLAGDAAHAHAGAAERLLALDHAHVEAELRGADGGHVAARARADDDHVVLPARGVAAAVASRVAHARSLRLPAACGWGSRRPP